MIEILHIFNQLTNTSGRNDKESILKDNKNNELFKFTLNFLYNPYILTGINAKKLNKKVKEKGITFYEFDEIANYIMKNNTGTDSNIATVQNFINIQPSEMKEFYSQVFTKSLKVGITADTINKIIGKDFIPTFDVMLAEKYFDCEDKVKGEFILTKKLDGNRNVAINSDMVEMRTRQGQLNEGFVDVEKEIRLLPKGYVYDGEFIAVNNNDLNSADLYRETTSKVRKDGIKQGVVFHIFDMIPLEDFKKGISNIPCIERKKLLHNSISNLNLKWIQEVPMLYVGSDKSVILPMLDKMIADGEEGLMLNLSNAPYECKRSKVILKIKKMQTVDLKIVGFEEGDGRLKGTLGRMNVDYKGNVVGVGSGYTDEDRTFIWNNRDSLLDKIVEVQYFEESSNAKTGDISLRFPVFKTLRYDKIEPSYY